MTIPTRYEVITVKKELTLTPWHQGINSRVNAFSYERFKIFNKFPIVEDLKTILEIYFE